MSNIRVRPNGGDSRPTRENPWTSSTKSIVGRAKTRSVRSIARRTAMKIVKGQKEWKFKDYTLSGTMTSSGVFQDVSAILPDTAIASATTRDGERVFMRSIKLRGAFALLPNAVSPDEYNTLRVVLFQWHVDDTITPPTFALLFQDPTQPWKSAYNHENGSKFSVIRDRFYIVGINGITAKPVSFTARIGGKKGKKRFVKSEIKYNSGSVSTGYNKFFILFVTDSSAVSHPFGDFYTRTSWYD